MRAGRRREALGLDPVLGAESPTWEWAFIFCFLFCLARAVFLSPVDMLCRYSLDVSCILIYYSSYI